jgi:4-nitrophenyl phosphatase
MAEAQLTQIQKLIIDMDGVLFRLNTPIAGAAEFVQFLRQMDKRFVLVTNNSTLSIEQYVHKLAGMGIAVSAEDILTSGEATALYLASVAPAGSRVYVIGENGIRVALQAHGFVLADDSHVPYVVAALDRQLTYDKLKTATLAIRAGALFIGTNPDRTLPTEEGLIPGARAILAALEVATDVAPLIIGKPEPAMLEFALQKLQAEPKTTAIVGDGLETDIPGGRRMGLMTILMMSGVTAPEQLAGSALQPDLVYADIAALHRAWVEALKPAKATGRGERRIAG